MISDISEKNIDTFLLLIRSAIISFIIVTIVFCFMNKQKEKLLYLNKKAPVIEILGGFLMIFLLIFLMIIFINDIYTMVPIIVVSLIFSYLFFYTTTILNKDNNDFQNQINDLQNQITHLQNENIISRNKVTIDLQNQIIDLQKKLIDRQYEVMDLQSKNRILNLSAQKNITTGKITDTEEK
ncbi:MAG: hypothetical protein PHV39_02905 [Methanomicrobium sp.]|nr:hypothetical protein [Methanomicrobium sp.]